MLADLRALSDISQVLRQTTDVRGIYGHAITAVNRVTEAEAGGILKLTPPGPPRVRARWGFSDERLSAFAAAIAEARSQPVWVPRLIPDLSRDNRLAAIRPRLASQQIGALGFFPMIADRRSQGSLVLCYERPHSFSPDEITLLESIATQAAYALRHRRLERRLKLERDAVYRSPTVIFIRSSAPGWPVEFVTPNVHAVFGWTPRQLVQNRLGYADLVHPEDRSRLLAAHQRHAVERVRSFQQEYRLLDSEGRYHRVWEYGVFDIRSGRPRVHGHVREIGEGEAGWQMLDVGAGHDGNGGTPAMVGLPELSHTLFRDLRVPLLQLAGLPQAVVEQAGTDLPGPALDTLRTIEGSVVRMAALVNGLLEYAALQEEPLQTEAVDMVALCRSVWEELEPLRRGRTILLYFQELLPVQGDPALVRRLLAELLTNAIRATAQSRAALVRIIAESEGPMARFSVLDNGPGIPVRDRERIFSLFGRVDNGTFPPGFGLGLAIAERIVRRHGGRIWVEPLQASGGALHFTLPQARLG